MAGHTLHGLRRRLSRSVARHGRLGALARALTWPAGVARRRLARPAADYDFDRRYGVETAKHVDLVDLDVEGANWTLGKHYQPISSRTFAAVMERLQIQHKEFTFIDLGSGKGKALLLASRNPFRRIVGVEFAPELHEIARRNVRAYRDPEQRCTNIELVCADAAAYRFPPEPTVLFLFNPFGDEVLREVLANLAPSLTSSPRPLYVIYCGPTRPDAFDGAAYFSLREQGAAFRIFEAVPAPCPLPDATSAAPSSAVLSVNRSEGATT